MSTDSEERFYGEQDEQDFASDVYVLAESSTDELLNSWKVFTALKDESYQGRRLENAAWRLHAMQKLASPFSRPFCGALITLMGTHFSCDVGCLVSSNLGSKARAPACKQPHALEPSWPMA